MPTGDGKTILAAHSVSVARDAWVEKDYPLVLLLVPTNTIFRQTVNALKNTRHAYRQVLDYVFKGRVRIFDISDFTHIRPHDLREHCCIVVGTIQTLRVKSAEGRKVYAHSEMEPHFSAVRRTSTGLEMLENGAVAARAALSERARDDVEYIRPIVLFQVLVQCRGVSA